LYGEPAAEAVSLLPQDAAFTTLTDGVVTGDVRTSLDERFEHRDRRMGAAAKQLDPDGCVYDDHRRG